MTTSASVQNHTLFLSSLLPYNLSEKTKKRLVDGFHEYSLLLKVTKSAVEALKLGQLSQFDPLVGENACQIRALKLACLAKQNMLDLSHLLEHVDKSFGEISNFILDSHNLKKSDLSLQDFFHLHDLDIEIKSEEKYLIASHILTKTKKLKAQAFENPLVMNDTTDSKKIKEIAKVGSLFAKNLVTSLREYLAADSVVFVQESATQLNCSEKIKQMVSGNFIIIHNHLLTIPCFWTNQVLVNLAIARQIPIILIAEQKAKDQSYSIVDKITLCFEVKEGQYHLTKFELLDKDSPAIILYGSSCRNFEDLPKKDLWINELVSCGPVDLMLAYAAVHRQ